MVEKKKQFYRMKVFHALQQASQRCTQLEHKTSVRADLTYSRMRTLHLHLKTVGKIIHTVSSQRSTATITIA